jgi:hypothetical protein
MCNLYSINANPAAINGLFRGENRYVGNLPPIPGVFPDYPIPVISSVGGIGVAAGAIEQGRSDRNFDAGRISAVGITDPSWWAALKPFTFLMGLLGNNWSSNQISLCRSRHTGVFTLLYLPLSGPVTATHTTQLQKHIFRAG